MGGIKNKLKQLSNKVANLVFSARLGSSVRRSLLDGVDNKTFNLASTARGGGLRSKPVGLLSITKYASIACFTLALISTIGLNLYRTYSSSNVRTNAVDGSTNSELAAQADIDPTSISLSITSSPSSSTDSNNPNLSLQIPQGGGIATGRHTVTVGTGSSVIGYELTLSSNDNNETALVNNDASSSGSTDSSDSKPTIPTTTGTLANPSALADKTYGYTLDNPDDYDDPATTPIWRGLQPRSNPATIATVDKTDNTLILGQPNEATHNIYYGVNIQNPEQTRTGNYSRGVLYTAIGELIPEPEVTDLALNSSWTDNTPDTAYGSTSILTGQNLNSITGIYIDLNGNTVKDDGEAVTNLTHATGNEANTKLTFTAPTYTEEGQKNVYLEWAGGEPVKIENGWSYIKSNTCISGAVNTDCQVDIDPGMFAVRYAGDSWSLVNPRYIDGFVPGWTGEWYDYSSGKWANAITVRSDFEKGCYEINDEGGNLNVSLITDSAQCSTDMYTPKDAYSEIQSYWLTPGNLVNMTNTSFSIYDDFILGYWVYIPRYSYEVMRRDAIDLVQQPEDFKIKFETASTAKKVPVEGCNNQNNTNDPKSYRVGCGLDRTYTNTGTNTETNTVTGTTWATHPAFTWMDEDGNPVELNGIWVGKFETTGSTEEPTVLPNEYHLYNGNIGDYYDIAQSIGIEDPNNLYGNVESPSYNNGKGYHNLSTTTSHMLKNSEWGAVAYLSASRYGVGVNNVQINANASSGNDGNDDSSYGITGCGPNGSSQYNTENGQLASTTNNIYGVYDMAGGAYEYVMGSYTDESTQSYPSNGYITYKVKPPYVDLYVNPPFNGNEGTNNNLCTWTTCGGHALFETAGWGDDYFYFVHSSNPWFLRGGYANADSAGTGVFYSGVSNGRTLGSNSFRVGLAALSAM